MEGKQLEQGTPLQPSEVVLLWREEERAGFRALEGLAGDSGTVKPRWACPGWPPTLVPRRCCEQVRRRRHSCPRLGCPARSPPHLSLGLELQSQQSQPQDASGLPALKVSDIEPTVPLTELEVALAGESGGAVSVGEGAAWECFLGSVSPPSSWTHYPHGVCVGFPVLGPRTFLPRDLGASLAGALPVVPCFQGRGRIRLL